MSKQANPPPDGGKPMPTAPPPPPAWRNWLWPIMFLAILALFYLLPTRSTSTSLTYSQFLSDVSSHQVQSLQISGSVGGTSTGTLKKNNTSFTVVIPPQAGQTSLDDLTKNIPDVSTAASGEGFGTEVLIYLIVFGLPILLFFWLFRRISRGAAGGLQGVLGAGRSRAKVFDEERPSTTFADVAGYEGAKSEIAEVVDFLREPERYARAGAMVPRGVLMIGPPGTGKTLLARAVAGEAKVPFISVTGSSFVEMFVGVGAARVRDLFDMARKRAPAIIFIDEIDAIGQRRAGSGAIVSNDEREQTLNQLLAEMDGFEPSAGVVVLAATNRPEVLDPALLRPGRFDRQVTIPLPNVTERAAILVVHTKDKKLSGVDLNAVARGTPGFSGADLANLANEAAIFAVRDHRDVVTASDFDAARDRIILGRREGSNVLLPEEKHAVAVHESGHAMVAALSEHADPVAKVTILPAGQTLGVTEQLPLVERHMYGEDYLLDSLAVRLGGRASELVVIGQGSTGASNDLAGATDLAIKMVREFGLSKTLGPIGYPEGGSVFLGGGGGGGLSSRPFAEATQAEIDKEVSALLRDAETRAINLLTAHRPELDSLVSLLLEVETVDGSDVYRLAGRPDRSSIVPPVPVTTHVAPRAAATSDAGTAPLAAVETATVPIETRRSNPD